MDTKQHSYKEAPAVRRYRIIAGTTVGAVIFLILVGAVVRMTGSGMGCPDWPTCFGKLVPPTDISQLPADYKTRFAVAGKEIADFDAFKTWVEYINRLLGVLIGLFSVGTVVASVPIRKTFPRVFWLSLGGLLAVLVVGGVGAYVVRTDLHEGVVTLHMILALGALAFFLLAMIRSYDNRVIAQVKDRDVPVGMGWGIALTALVLIQIVLGTQVREEIDLIAKNLGEGTREFWIGELGQVYSIHRVFYYAIVGALIGLGMKLRSAFSNWRSLKYFYVGLWMAVGLEVMLGLGMHYTDIPAWMQPAHLLLATLLFTGSTGLTTLLWMTRSLSKSPNLMMTHD